MSTPIESRVRLPRVERPDGIARYFRDIRTIPLLTKDDEYRLFSRLDELRREFFQLLAALDESCRSAVFEGDFPGSPFRSYDRIEDVCTKLHLYVAEHPDQHLKQLVDQAYRYRSEIQLLRHKAVESNLLFVAEIAGKYLHFGLPYLDLIQAGNTGLMEAVDPYDQNHGTRFLTYAIWHIRKAILRALKYESRTIRLPDHVLKKFRRMKEAQAEFLKEEGRLPSTSELAKRMGARPEAVEELFIVLLDTVSFDAPRGDAPDAEPMSANIPAPSPTRAQRHEHLEELERLLNRLLTHLTDRQRRVLRLRFGLNGAPCLNLEQIGTMLDVTREAIRQLEQKALRKMRRLVTKKEFAILVRFLDTRG